MRGIELPLNKQKLESILEIIKGFKAKDFKVTLGSVLDEKERQYYSENKFKLLVEEINSTLIRL